MHTVRGCGQEPCALPFLTDAIGIYYDKDLLSEARYTGPQKVIYQVAAGVAKRLAEFDPETVQYPKVARFIPWFRFYGSRRSSWSMIFGADYCDADGTPPPR